MTASTRTVVKATASVDICPRACCMNRIFTAIIGPIQCSTWRNSIGQNAAPVSARMGHFMGDTRDAEQRKHRTPIIEGLVARIIRQKKPDHHHRAEHPDDQQVAHEHSAEAARPWFWSGGGPALWAAARRPKQRLAACGFRMLDSLGFTIGLIEELPLTDFADKRAANQYADAATSNYTINSARALINYYALRSVAALAR